MNPDQNQLVFWSLREGILQRLSPHEAKLPADRISFNTMSRISALYKASLERWNAREALELEAARKASRPIAELLAETLAALPLNCQAP